MKKTKVLCLTVLFAMVLQMFAPINFAVAIDNEIPSNQINVTKANLIITDASNQVIPPSGGTYSNVPKDAKIEIEYAFDLLDNNGLDSSDSNYEEYTYTSLQAITVNMPAGVDFSSSVPSAGIPLKTAGGDEIGTLTISGSTIVINFNSYVETHSNMGGLFNISGTFDSSVTSNPSPATITFVFNGTTFTINVNQDLPPTPAPDLIINTEKSGVYDFSSNTITWTVKVKPTNTTGSSISVEDVYSLNQQYIDNTFAIDGVTTSSGLTVDTSNRKLTYIFSEDILVGVEKTITYQTSPTSIAFNGETSSSETVDFTNTATVKSGLTDKGTAIAKIQCNWIQKSGGVDSSNFTLIHWTININNDSKSINSNNQTTTTSQAISNPVITDILPAGVDLVEGSVKFDGVAVTSDSSISLGKYNYNSSTKTLVYSHNGTITDKKVLTYDTIVSNPNSDLNKNGQVTYSNNANLHWIGNVYGMPSDGASVGVGKSVISKSAAGGAAFKNGSSDTITWTISVNANKIKIANPIVTDDFVAGLEYVAQSFTIDGLSGSAVSGTLTTSSSGIQYSFDNEINETHTITFKTRVTDYSKFFANSNSISFANTAKLYSSDLVGGVQNSSTSKAFSSEIIKKIVATVYDYTTRRVKWQIVVNANKIPLKNAVVSDILPIGMKFLDNTFQVRDQNNILVTSSAGILGYTNVGDDTTTSSDSFTYALSGTADTDKYTITYETEMKEKYIKESQFSTQNFTNTAGIFDTNYNKTVSSSAIQVIKNLIVEKKSQYVTGADTINWIVPMNTGKVSWPTGITISDQLQNELDLNIDSVQLYYMDLNPNGTLTKSNPLTPLPKTDYTITYSGKLFTLSIPGPITDIYQLEFTTDVLADTAIINNSVTFQGAAFNAGSTSSAVVVNINDVNATGYGMQGKIIVIKEDATDSTKKLSGATFQLYDINKNPIAGKIGVADSSGQLIFDSIRLRTYYIGEFIAPNGYLLNTDLKKVRLDSVTTIASITLSNEKATENIEFQKQTAAGQPLGGAEFTLYGKGSTIPLKTAISDNTGKVVFPGVEVGDYEIKETKAPSGYYASTDIIDIKIETVNSNTSMKVTLSKSIIKNTPIPGVSFGTVIVTKTDENGKLLSGAQFTLYNANGIAVQSGMSGTDGKLSFNNLISGSYTIEETAAPEGYELNSNDYPVTVSGDSKAFTIVNKVKKIIGSITVIKNDDKGEALAGAEFKLVDEKGITISTATTYENGYVMFNKVPQGNYTVTETKAPDGYILNQSSRKVTVDSTQTKTVTFINKKQDVGENNNGEESKEKGTIIINKIDGKSNPLPGAEFTLLDKEGNIIAKIVSDIAGQVIFTGLKAGEYQIQETKAPVGYTLISKKLNVKLDTDQTHKLNFRDIRLEEVEDNKIPLGWIDPVDKDNPKPNDNRGKLPQAGEWMDTFVMLSIGAGLVILGGIQLVLRKKRRKQAN